MSQDKAAALVQEAVKKSAVNPGGFFSMFSNPEAKIEEAADLYVQAANIYKMEKKWADAGKCFVEAAKQQLRLKSQHEAASQYIDASNCYKKVNPQEAALCLEEAVTCFVGLGRFAIAAKHLTSLAELYEKEINDSAKAIEYYEKAADYFEGEESGSASNKVLLKVADLSAEQEKYERSIEIYEKVATSMADNSLLKWGAKEYFLKAGLCRLASGDVVAAQGSVGRYGSIYSGFQGTREELLLKRVCDAVEQGSADDFTKAVTDHDQIMKLTDWMTTILLRIKKSIGSDDLK